MRLLLLFLWLLLFTGVSAQYGFRSPVDAEIKLAANFGELRDNHFHSGLDIITNSEEGWSVYAVEDGFVSRILMSRKGYGNALFIDHPNGLTSVYAHLSGFNSTIAAYAETIQLLREEYELDTLLPLNAIPVHKGDIVAYSGNTGGSTGPHLHFEIRDTKSEHILNPENFGFDITDTIIPKIFSLSLFSLNDYKTQFLQTRTGISGKTITVEPGRVGVGITGIDYYTGRAFTAGIYSVKLFCDEKLVFEKRMDTFSFDNWRCINQHIDYEQYKTKSLLIEKCFRDDGNKSEVYRNLVDNGIISLAPEETKQVKIVVADHAGNQRELNFTLKGGYENYKPQSKYNAVPADSNVLKAKGAVLIIPPGAVYDTCYFLFKADTTYRSFSYKFIVGDRLLPLQREVKLQIAPLKLPKVGTEKFYVKSWPSGSIGGTFTNGVVSAGTKTCGTYSLEIDTLKPVIQPLNVVASKNIHYYKTLKFRIYDSQSGVKKYHATLNGKFILFSYDLKYNLITAHLDEDLPRGKYLLELTVTDNCNNTARYSASLYN